MKTGYKVEYSTWDSNNFIYQFNFKSLNEVGNYGFDKERKEYKSHTDCIGVWKITLKN